MEVVQDFVNSPSLEKFKNIPSPQRKSLLAEYFKVCNMVCNSLLVNCFIVNQEITWDDNRYYFCPWGSKKKK